MTKIKKMRQLASSVISGQPKAGEVEALRALVAEVPRTAATDEAIAYAEDALASVGKDEGTLNGSVTAPSGVAGAGSQ